MSQAAHFTFRRVVVGFDTAGESTVLVETATGLARAMRTEIHGVFVEDSEVLELAGLPFVRFVQHGGGAQQVSSERMRAALVRQAAACERALSQSAQRARLAWSFGRAQGAFRDEIRAQARSGDLIVVRVDPQGGRAVVEALDIARSACSKASGVAVVPARARAIRGPLAIIAEGDRSPARILALAREIAGRRQEMLTVFLVGSDPAAMPEMEARLREAAGGSRIVVQEFVGPGVPQLAALVREFGPSMVVVDLEGRLFGENAAALAIIGAAAAPVILLGAEG